MGKIKLFCIPHAGGMATHFVKWNQYLDGRIELHPLELAGRGLRVKQELYRDMNEAAEDMFRLISNQIDDSPYAIFGHSLGCWITYELYFKLSRSGFKKPVRIFFSGNHAPYADKPKTDYYLLSDEDLLSTIKGMGGTTEEVLYNKEMVDYIIPIIRNDFRIAEQYNYHEKCEKIDVDITVMAGKNDSEVTASDLLKWKKCAQINCNIHQLRGGHFYIFEDMEQTASIINNSLSAYCNRT